MKVSYFAFDIFDKSGAGYVHTREITNSLSKYVDLELTLMPPKKDFVNPFIWSKNGHDYSRFTLWFKPYLIPALPMNLLSWYKVYQKTKKFKADIIHERFHSPNPFGVSIFKKLNTKSILSSNNVSNVSPDIRNKVITATNKNSLSYNSKNIKRVLEVNSPYVEDSPYHGILKKIIEKDREVQFENCDAIITQTETLKKVLERVTDKDIYVVPNGVNTDLFRPMKVNRKDIGLPDGVPVICFSGSFQKWHGVHLIPEIIKRMNGIWFLLIGDCSELKNMGLRQTVFVDTVPYDQSPYYLNMADVFIAPFDSGQFKYFEEYGMWWSPMKMYEYMAIGKPIVSFDYPEVRNIVGNHGLLAKVGDLDDFIDKLWTLVENKGVAELMGKKAREKAVMEYGWDKRATETIKVYNSVLSP